MCHTLVVPPPRPALPRARGPALAPATLAAAIAWPSPGSIAEASPPPDALARPPQAIVGGEPSSTCAWPSVVALQGGGLCTATLIHPRVVAYAAHCGTLQAKVYFGESIDSPAREVDTLYCERNSPLFAVSSMDYAFCVLAEPVVDIPVTPPLIGCDQALIEVGTPVTIVGFGDVSGEDEPESTGIKHEAETEITAILTTIGIGGMGVGADAGDSGGPAFVELDDGSWRLLGLVSGGGGDGATVQYVPAPLIVPWIEDQTGIDVSPCHVGEGGWAPTPACEGFYISTAPEAAWAEGCPGQRSPPSERCGPPWTEIVDPDPPTVSFVVPLDGDVLLGPPAVFGVVAEADDAEGVGVGGLDLRLRVDGQPWLDAHGEPALDQVPPFSFPDVELDSAGPHELTLEAVDPLGNASEATITVVVGDPGPGETGDTGEPADTGETGTGPSETGDPSQAEDGGSGCACGLADERRPSALALVGLSALLLGRRRRLGRVSGVGGRRRVP